MNNVTDADALAILNRQSNDKASRIATKFVPRTIVYPIKITRSNGQEEVEIRTFVRASEYTTPRRWEKALEIEKEYKKLNEAYTQALKDAGVPDKYIFPKEVANPLKFTPLT